MSERRWTSPAELRAGVITYLAGWWRTDRSVSALALHDPGLLARLEAIARERPVDTADVYCDADGSGLAGRVKVHDAIIKKQLGTATEMAEPVAYFTLGPMGSGKTSVLRPLVDRHRTHAGRVGPMAVVAADEVREQLPEFKDGLGSLVVQQECLDVTYARLFRLAVERHADIVFDTIGTFTSDHRPSIAPSLEALRNHGYKDPLVGGTRPARDL